MRIIDAVKKCVVFLGLPTKDEHGQDTITFSGTGFLMGVLVEGKKEPVIYLVTAKHIEVKLNSKKFAIRANTKAGGARLFWFENPKWHHHPADCSADIAIMRWDPPTDLDTLHMESGLCLTNKTMEVKGIGVGTEVFLAGLFVKHTGSSRNLPIVRTGNIAMLPDEPVPTTHFGNMEVYLIEARSIGGLSGSPVLAKSNAGETFLIGAIHGHWDVPSTAIQDVPSDDGKCFVNIGVALVTPAFKIYETLHGPELTSLRESEP